MRTAPEQTKRARRLTSVLFFSRREMNLKSLRGGLQSSETELRAEHARARDEVSRPGGGFRRVEKKIRAHDRR